MPLTGYWDTEEIILKLGSGNNVAWQTTYPVLMHDIL